MKSRKYLIIALIVIGFITAITLLSFYQKNTEQTPTGGSGVPELGYLVLTGYETPSNDNSKIQLGEFLSPTQQKNIRSFLSALLYESEQRDEYKGSIVPGSVNVNYTTSVIEFNVQIEEPDVLYKVTYNPLNDDMKVFDKNDQSLVPRFNPDGSPFESFHSSSQLAR